MKQRLAAMIYLSVKRPKLYRFKATESDIGWVYTLWERYTHSEGQLYSGHYFEEKRERLLHVETIGK
jgi:hypothetical protein